MAIRVQNHLDSSSNNIFHHNLVKLLIAKELEKHGRSWSHFLFWSGFKVEFKEDKEGKIKQTHTQKKVLKTPTDIEEVNTSTYLSENEIEDHHKGEVPKKEMTIQTPAKFEQRNPEELKDFSKGKNSLDKIQIAKK